MDKSEVGIVRGAELSPCGKYRFSLWRIWDFSKPYVLFIGLNPSTADDKKNDPTIRRCFEYAKSWGYGGLYMANLFAFRATNPKELQKIADPIGQHNNQWISQLAQNVDLVVAAWGNYGSYLGRSKAVCTLIPHLFCLKINKNGEPAHPLYLPKTLKPILFARI